MQLRKKFLRATFLTMLAALPGITSATVVDNTLLISEPSGINWAGYGRTFDEQRYSPLKQIDARNVGKLGLAWSLELPDVHSVTTVPLAIDGVIYFAAGYSVVHAVDARTGKLLWRYDPEVGKVAPDKMRRAWGSRGLAFYKGRVFVGTVDGRLVAVDAKTGKPVWSVQTLEQGDSRYITGAPRVFNDKVIIGHGGADYGAVRGYVTAYDVNTGKQAWRFHVVPGNPADGFENKAMEMAAKTWTGEWWKMGGGGTVWNAMTYDPEYNRIYLGTGNGAPWNQKIRSPGGGDNLFLCSIVALDADTGEYVWHYQTNPGETWDYNSAMDMVLATVAIDGKPRQVILHAPKNGFFYVIDRATGKLISAEKIAKVTWASKIDIATGRPVEEPNARYQSGETLIWPGDSGAHSWYPMAYSPDTQLTYIPVREVPGYYSDKGVDLAHWQFKPGFNYANGLTTTVTSEEVPKDLAKSALLAWNPATQKQAWRVPTPGPFSGGILTSAGNLVLQADAAGKLNAYSADQGKLLWSFDLRVGTLSPPITYSIDGKQYVSILAGWGGAVQAYGALSAQQGWVGREQPRRLLTFALDAKGQLAVPPIHSAPTPLDDPDFALDPQKVKLGQQIFTGKCVICHGIGAVAGGYAPDLRASAFPFTAEGFATVVRQGALEQRGMPKFSELSDSELEAMRHYIRKRARDALVEQKPVSEKSQ
jgi:quinohemoprotein ethanol dehydrogenase